MTASGLFHPVVAEWFEHRFSTESDIQKQAWPEIHSGQSVLMVAPTGSGKTLAAFLAVIDQLVRQELAGSLPDSTQILYISPLKALSNDIHKNLNQPLLEIDRAFLEQTGRGVLIRAQVRTGDTSQSERQLMKRHPPHILVTTPESLYILLTSASGREMLKSVRSVIVDEIHALAGNKRGAHLMLSLSRLETLTETRLDRIGLSATQKPLETIAHFLMGDKYPCKIINTGHNRHRDLRIEVTGSPLEGVMANEVWTELYDVLEQLIMAHTTTLIFVNTRRLAERAAAALAERLGDDAVTAHHGSLAKEHRLSAEKRLKEGQLKALVATASLELGIDIGDVDLVCQLGSPRSISTFLQRVGRSGHRLTAVPKGRLFPLSRDDLLECMAILSAIKRNELDQIKVPEHPLDVLAQQIVAEVASQEWDETALYKMVTSAWPYRNLTRQKFSAVVAMLADGFHTRRGRRSAYIHRDAVHGKMRARKSARLTALLNGGAIPDQFDYDVIMQPAGLFVGSLNEDFAFESLPGDIFQLGNNSYRMLKIEQGKVFVEDAHGLPPNIPFWFGESPGRTDELSLSVSRLSARIDQLLEHDISAANQYLQQELGVSITATEQLVEYLAVAKASLTVLPTLQQIVFERFFDETGDMHLVIHSPYGSRVNRAWGLALRKRFCRRFNFELQAAASEDNIVLSLGPTHSFPLHEPAGYLNSETVKGVLVQALLDAPMFPTRWRWVANTALAVPRNRAGKKVPAPFQRNDAEDLVAVIFPDQLACLENISGEREVPDHPLVEQTLWDCMNDLMDISGLRRLLQGLENGSIKIICRDLSCPSLLSQEILNARPYAFLDDAPAEERRTLAIQQRRFSGPKDAAAIGCLDQNAITKVKMEAWPIARDEDELHDLLVIMGFITEQEGQERSSSAKQNRPTAIGSDLMEGLMNSQRATIITLEKGQRLWVAAERLGEFLMLIHDAFMDPRIAAVAGEPITREVALEGMVRSRLEGLGPVTSMQIAQSFAMPVIEIDRALLALEQQGIAVQGKFSCRDTQTEWCERGLLARIHRYSIKQLRSEIQPVAPADYMRFLFRWHGLGEPGEGEFALKKILQQLEGFSIQATAWEKNILPCRISPYLTSQLDQLCSSGEFIWLRLKRPASTGDSKARKPVGKNTAIAMINREYQSLWRLFSQIPELDDIILSSAAIKVYSVLKQWGASFFQELVTETGLLKTQVQEALGELISHGLITADSFQGLRQLILSQKVQHRRGKRFPFHDPFVSAGRWSLIRPGKPNSVDKFEAIEYIARTLLKRYGVVFRKVLDREDNIPSWRELLYAYRRLEARGEIRGGRFVEGFAGEQFALPESIKALREARRLPKNGDLFSIGAVDPLNLTGIITPGERISALVSQRILYQDGIPLAYSASNNVKFLQEVKQDDEWQFKTRIMQL